MLRVLPQCHGFDWNSSDERSLDEPLGYCSDTMTGMSSIYQNKGVVNGAGNRGGRWPNLCYLEHLSCGRNHVLEAIDRVSCGLIVRGHARLPMEERPTEFCLDIADEEDCFFWVEPSDAGCHDLIGGVIRVNK